MEKKRSKGITLVAIFSIMVGLYFLYEKHSGIHYLPQLIEAKQWLVLSGILIDFLYIIAGIGLLRRLNWSRKLFIFITFVFLIGVIRSSFYLIMNDMIAQYSPILMVRLFMIMSILFVFSLIYLTRPKVKEQFK